MLKVSVVRHSGGRRNPFRQVFVAEALKSWWTQRWIPACAGMTANINAENAGDR
jgi:hypothetical protein